MAGGAGGRSSGPGLLLGFVLGLGVVRAPHLLPPPSPSAGGAGGRSSGPGAFRFCVGVGGCSGSPPSSSAARVPEL